MGTLTEVTIPAVSPARLTSVLGEARTDRFEEAARALSDSNDGATIWNVNSTASGGGVAEMLRGLLPWARGAGIDSRWLVIQGNAPFFNAWWCLVESSRHRDSLRTELPSGPALPADAPLVLQISRWDRAKDMSGVMRAFAEHVVRSSPAHLILAGPTTSGVADDPEANDVLADSFDTWQRLTPHERSRIHLACLPMHDVDENAAIVNALQRRASVVTQKSLAEGFGLTVAEAMWKERPVVASAVGGMKDQIDDGFSGILVTDPQDLVTFGAAISRLLSDEALRDQLGKAAAERVRERYLGDVQLERWTPVIADVATACLPSDDGETG